MFLIVFLILPKGSILLSTFVLIFSNRFCIPRCIWLKNMLHIFTLWSSTYTLFQPGAPQKHHQLKRQWSTLRPQHEYFSWQKKKPKRPKGIQLRCPDGKEWGEDWGWRAENQELRTRLGRPIGGPGASDLDWDGFCLSRTQGADERRFVSGI